MAGIVRNRCRVKQAKCIIDNMGLEQSPDLYSFIVTPFLPVQSFSHVPMGTNLIEFMCGAKNVICWLCTSHKCSSCVRNLSCVVIPGRQFLLRLLIGLSGCCCSMTVAVRPKSRIDSPLQATQRINMHVTDCTIGQSTSFNINMLGKTLQIEVF